MKSKTVLVVDTYEAISDLLPVMWPHYEKSGADVVGIERTNKATRWPKSVPVFAIGEDAFTSWAERKDDPYLCNRWLDIIAMFLEYDYFDRYDNLCCFEWDAVFFKPLPELNRDTGLILNLAGWTYPGFKAPYFFHMPWFMDRKRAELILGKGRSMVEAGDIEHGSPDFFLGLLVTELKLPWTPIHFFTQNRIESNTQRNQARLERLNGAYGAHGIRDKETLDYILTV